MQLRTRKIKGPELEFPVDTSPDVVDAEVLDDGTVTSDFSDEPTLLASVADCKALAGELQETNLRGLVIERLRELGIESPGDSAWGLALVDILDDMQQMRSSYSQADASVISRIEQVLRALLVAHGGERINDMSHIPERQRAVKVEHCLPEGASSRICPTGVSGLIMHGELIRKQEVFLQLSPN